VRGAHGSDGGGLVSTDWRSFCEAQDMKTTIPLFYIVLIFVSINVSPKARATCQEGCLTNENTVLGEDVLLNDQGSSWNTAIGSQALFSTNIGSVNTAIGFDALYSNTVGGYNTAIGSQALFSNTDAHNNTAIGASALYSNNTGWNNTATGFGALQNNTVGTGNTANGVGALPSNTVGNFNTASGFNTLVFNTTGSNNAAYGYYALLNNTTGTENTANGAKALLRNTNGIQNTASGLSALGSNTTGNQNTADGTNSSFRNTTGVANVAVGYYALFHNTTGGSNTALGAGSGSNLTTGGNNIDIGNQGVAGEGNTIRIGTTGTQTNTYIAGISGMTVAGGVGVIIDSSGHLGTVVSSARFKDAIKPMDKVSEAILALKPVTFHYKRDLDPNGIPQFGLVAEEVEKVNPDLVVRDEQGKPYTVRYEAVNAMLLNEFLKEHRKVEELEANAVRQQKQIDALTAGLQKVSAQLELSKPAPQTVLNNR